MSGPHHSIIKSCPASSLIPLPNMRVSLVCLADAKAIAVLLKGFPSV